MVSVSIVGATGRVGSAILSALLAHLESGRITHLKILTSSPDKIKSEIVEANHVTVTTISYSDAEGLFHALAGTDILISAIGTGPTQEGAYEDNKAILIDAAAKAGVKVYAPSEYGTDHNTDAATSINSPMFANKQEHHLKAESLGLRVCALYTGLLLEGSFSAWLSLDSSVPSPTWALPRPSYPVAFTSLTDIGNFVLSATLQALVGNNIPSRLRVYSDCLTVDSAADEWEKATGCKITRTEVGTEELRKRWEAFRQSNAPSRLGPAIPLLMSLEGFDHSTENDNTILLHDGFATSTRSASNFFSTIRFKEE